MKICLTGSHGTGKTTILNELKKLPQFKDYKFISEVLRNLGKEGLPLNKESNNETQLLAFNEYIKLFILNKDFISDRGLFDVRAYTKAAWLRGNIKDFILEYQAEVIGFYKNYFDKIIYFPIEFSLELDGVRDEDLLYQEEIDDYIKRILKEEQIPFITVSGTVEQRLETILKNI